MLEWLIPPFNSGHWSPQLVDLAGGIDVLGPKFKPSTTISFHDVILAQPDIILLSCCGFSRDRTFKDVQLLLNNDQWQKIFNRVNGEIYLIDGNAYFSRPGPRLIDAMEALAYTLHNKIFPNEDSTATISHISEHAQTLQSS